MQFSFPCPHYACIQPPASEGFSHQPIPLIFEGEGWMIFTLAWVWFLHTRDTLEHFVSLTQQGKACESAEGDLLWALSKHGINLVGGCTLLSLIFGCVSCSDETFEGRHLKGSAACVDLIVHNWNHSVFPCNKKEPSLTCLQHLLRIWVVGLNRSLIRPVLNFDLFLYQAFWCFLQLCILNALILSYILVKCVFPLLPPPTLVWGSLIISFTTAKALCPPCPPPVLQAMLQDRACPPNPRSLEFSSIVPAYQGHTQTGCTGQSLSIPKLSPAITLTSITSCLSSSRFSGGTDTLVSWFSPLKEIDKQSPMHNAWYYLLTLRQLFLHQCSPCSKTPLLLLLLQMPLYLAFLNAFKRKGYVYPFSKDVRNNFSPAWNSVTARTASQTKAKPSGNKCSGKPFICSCLSFEQQLTPLCFG